MYYTMSDKVCMDLMTNGLFIKHDIHVAICSQLITTYFNFYKNHN